MTAPGPGGLLRHPVVCGGSPHALGLAVALARTGAQVTLIEDGPSDVQRAHDLLVRAKANQGIRVTDDLDTARGASLMVAATDTPTHDPLDQLAGLADPEALIARMGAGTAPTAAILSLESVAPPPEIGLLELWDHPQTPRIALENAKVLAGLLGVPSVVTPRPIAATLIATLEDAAEHLVFDGSTPWDVDQAMEDCGFHLGPCAAQDLRGLDKAYARHRMEEAQGTRHLPVLDRMVPEGRLGRKGGVGWYRYPGGGGRVIDPLVEDLAREEAHFARHTPQDIPADQIRARILSALQATANDLSRDVSPRMITQIAAVALDCAAIGPLLFPKECA